MAGLGSMMQCGTKRMIFQPHIHTLQAHMRLWVKLHDDAGLSGELLGVDMRQLDANGLGPRPCSCPDNALLAHTNLARQGGGQAHDAHWIFFAAWHTDGGRSAKRACTEAMPLCIPNTNHAHGHAQFKYAHLTK